MYSADKTYEKWNKEEMPEDIRADLLNNQQLADLNRLKDWLYKRRTIAKQKLERAERRQRKEENIAKRIMEQPALFTF